MFIFVVPELNDDDDDNICPDCGIKLSDPDHTEKHELVLDMMKAIDIIKQKLDKARWN